MPDLAVRLLTALETVGQQIFLQINISERVVISSENVGRSSESKMLKVRLYCSGMCAAIVVVKPGCGNTDNITVSSSELDESNTAAPGSNADSSIFLPPSVFGMGSNCMDVGLIVVVTDGIGPLLSADNILPSCEPPTAVLAHGRWLVLR